MKTKMNKLLLITMSFIAMSGCAATAVAGSDVSSINLVKTKVATKSTWKSKKTLALNKSKKEDCVDCYANVAGIANKKIAVNKVSKPVYSNDDSNRAVDSYDGESAKNNSYPYDVAEDSYVGENSYPTQSMPSTTPTIESFSNKTAIQVGAFRKYAGAKVYAKKYSLLSNRYDVEIKKNVKDNKPLYRVRIEGFSNRSEAKEFISKYGITEAFLVRN